MNRLAVLRVQWDRALAVVLLLSGLVLLLVGYRGVDDVPFASQQIPYVLSAGLGGVFLLGVSGTLWLSADLQDEWRKLDRLEKALERLPAAPAAPAAQPVLSDDREELLLRLAARLLDEQDVELAPPTGPTRLGAARPVTAQPAAPRQRARRAPSA
ncbi:MAG: hypothetical protein JWM64_1695 [Frankiales bacterium]|nr:hypothetical protein [Frankiales bacterium]